MQNPILVDRLFFGCTDFGVLTCFGTETGAIHYSERLGNGGEGFTASPVSDGHNVFFTSELGKVYVVPASGNFSVLATNKLGGTCMATPALLNGELFFRTRDRLVAVAK